MRLARVLTTWVILMAAETLHGVFRMLVLTPRVGDFRARQISVFTGSLLIVLVATLFIRWIQAKTRGSLMQVGLIWLVLTLVFEIGFGCFVLGRGWDRILSDYDISHGGLLPLGLLVLTLSPLVAARLRGKRIRQQFETTPLPNKRLEATEPASVERRR